MRKFIILFLLLNLASVSAEVMLSQPQSIYNLGDELYIKSIVTAYQDKADFFEMDLLCNNIPTNIYKVPLNLISGDSKTFETSLFLSETYSAGECKIISRYADEERESQTFKISNKLDINSDVTYIVTDTDKLISLTGTVYKENGKKAAGFIELRSSDINLTTLTQFNSTFSVNFSFPENAKSGEYTMKIKAYDKYKNNVLNSGEQTIIVKIKQKPKKLIILSNISSLSPENNFSFKIKLLDQAEDIIKNTISYTVYDSNNAIYLTKIAESDKDESIPFKINSIYGNYKIIATAFNLTTEQSFYLQEYEKADFNVINTTLIITNIGNTAYRKSIQVGIGNFSEIKNINLEYGESISLKLSAPHGEYDVNINDGSSKASFSRVSLTGNVIGVNEFRESFSFIKSYPIVWFFLIAISGLFVFNLYRRTTKNSSISYPVEVPLKKVKEGGVIKLKVDSNKENINIKDPKDAEYSVEINGKKEMTNILSIKIKNIEEAINTDIIGKIKAIISEEKGTTYVSNDFIFGIFSSLTTKKLANEMLALKTAQKISKTIKEYNNTHKIQVDFGISVTAGELILKKENKLFFSSVGKTLLISKKVASISNGEILIPESLHVKVMNTIKTERKMINNERFYILKSINDREEHSKFITDFVERQK